MHPATPIGAYLLAGVILVAVFARRIYRMRRSQRLRLESLWVLPAILLLAAAALVAQSPPSGLGWLWLAVALAAGGGLGWVRGGLSVIEVDPETHVTNTRASPAALAFLLALYLVRMGLRAAVSSAGPGLHIAALATDALMVFTVGLFGVSRLEMWLRGRRLVAAAKAATALRLNDSGSTRP